MIETAKRAAVEAGDFLYSNFGNITEIVSKGDRNLVTNLDKEAEKSITSAILKRFPSHGILAEEGSAKESEDGYLWIIDPLDGTHNFIRSIDIFGVSIGLWHKDRFILGVVYMPKDKELYWAQDSKGAFKNGKSIHVSEVSDIKKASGSFDSSIRYSPEIMLKALGKVSADCFNIRMLGSSVRQLTYIAEGKLDFAVEFHDLPWDFAGAVSIIREAGGVFSGLKGEAVTPNTKGYITSSKIIHGSLKDILSRVI